MSGESRGDPVLIRTPNRSPSTSTPLRLRFEEKSPAENSLRMSISRAVSEELLEQGVLGLEFLKPGCPVDSATSNRRQTASSS